MAQACPKCGLDGVDGAACPRCGVDIARYRAEIAVMGARVGPVVAPVPVSVTPPPMPRRPAGFWVRVVAVLIDAVLLTVTQAVLGFLGWAVLGFEFSPRPLRAALNVFSFILGTAYPIVFHWQWGQTLGKMAMQIRVVDMGGGPLSLGQATLRQIGSWLSALIFCIGYLMAGLRSDKRALHDLIAGTRVEHLS